MSELTLDDAKADTSACASVSSGTKRPLLVRMADVAAIDREARRYYSSIEGTGGYFRAIALLVGSPLSRVIGNFFIGLNRAPYPLRLFTDEADAVRWLEEYVE